MSDSLILPFSESDSLIVSSDNSGGIGSEGKRPGPCPLSGSLDIIPFRVAVMECLGVGGSPVSVVLNNFCGDEAWEDLTRGVREGLKEFGMEGLPITGSTESNMPLLQSAIGLMVIGKRRNEGVKKQHPLQKIALIGRPLVGEEVMDQQDWIAPLSLYKSLCEMEEVQALPVGSKGIAYEWKHLDPSGEGVSIHISNKVDIEKSSRTIYLLPHCLS